MCEKLVLVFSFTYFYNFYSVLGACSKTQIVSICAKIVFSQNCRDVKNEVFKKKIAFFDFCLFYVAARETEKKKNKMEKGPKTIKIVFFKVVIQK